MKKRKEKLDPRRTMIHKGPPYQIPKKPKETKWTANSEIAVMYRPQNQPTKSISVDQEYAEKFLDRVFAKGIIPEEGRANDLTNRFGGRNSETGTVTNTYAPRHNRLAEHPPEWNDWKGGKAKTRKIHGPAGSGRGSSPITYYETNAGNSKRKVQTQIKKDNE